MTPRLSEPPNLRRWIERSARRGRQIATRDHVLDLGGLARGSALGPGLGALDGRSVVLHVDDMASVAAALIDLDGLARRIVLCPPGWGRTEVESAARDAEADALVFDEGVSPSTELAIMAPCRLPVRPSEIQPTRELETEWVLATSGTSGPPKLVVHTLKTLTGAISPAPLQQWATFYDIRRYGGLQIFLRALSGEGSLTLSGAEESVDAFLIRMNAAGVTHISGTPSHWRKVLMSGQARRIDPEYVRLSGEIADDAVLEALGALYSRARIEHAYASTEAGVVFTVGDGKAGFPADWLEREGGVEMRVVDGALQVRSDRRALKFLGANAAPIADNEGFVDTGDMVERRDDRLYFVGRRGGVINVGGAKVHPEEVEAALNGHPAVRASRVFARRNPITGSLVMADVVLRDGTTPREGLERAILASCRQRLPAYKAPVKLRFLDELSLTSGGKLARDG